MLRMWALIIACILTLGGCIQTVAVKDAGEPGEEGETDIELICLTEQPAIVESESVSLKAWATSIDGRPIETALKLEWEVDTGHIVSHTSATKWDLSSVTLGSQKVRKVIATVKAIAQDGNELRCVVEVYIGKREAEIPDRGTLRGENLISAKQYLFPGDTEVSGYGLYSYLLFSAPPKDDDEEDRYLKAIEAYLLVLQGVDEYLRRYIRPRRLNITYIPLRESPKPAKSNTEWAENVLAVYDYATAQIMLNSVNQTYKHGPYLLSVLKPLSEQDLSAYLWEDLTGVVPELAWDWIKLFTYLAAQERSWSEATLRRFGLKLSNLIAVGGKVTPNTLKALEKLIEFKPKAEDLGQPGSRRSGLLLKKPFYSRNLTMPSNPQ